MSPEHKAKIAAARAAKSAEKAQVVTIDERWRVVRVDDRNWKIEFNGEFKGFYGTIASALSALPDKMLDETASGSLVLILRNVIEIKDTIQRALNPG